MAQGPSLAGRRVDRLIGAVGVAVVLRRPRDEGGSASTQTAKAPAPEVVVREVPAPDQQADELGFPAFATKNTTRISGADPIADAAAARSPSSPPTGDAAGPDAVTLVDADDWPAGIAARLAGRGTGRCARCWSPTGGEVPDLTASALAS